MGCGCSRSSSVVALDLWPVLADGPFTPQQGRRSSWSSSKRACDVLMVARIRLDRSPSDDLSSIFDVLEVPAKGQSMLLSTVQATIAERWNLPLGMQLLSCIDDKMQQGQEAMPPEARSFRVMLLEPEERDENGVKKSDRRIGDYGLPAENIWLHLTDYSKLRPSTATEPCCRIPDVTRRGVTLPQLLRVQRFVREYTGPGDLLVFWFDVQRGKALYGKDLNFYNLCQWVVNPSTYACRCSFAEILAAKPEEQVPSWFCSHWCGGTLAALVQCLQEHSRVRGLPDALPYWVCAFAQNQYQLNAEVHQDPSQSSSARAMRHCDGVLLIMDELATTLTRTWCCYELYMALAHDPERLEPLLVDTAVSIKVPQGLNTVLGASILTDGLTEAEQLQEENGSSGWSAKAKREADFPLHVIAMALGLDVINTQATWELDRRRLLNHVTGLPLEALAGEPAHQHAAYAHLNSKLRAMFALASWRLCIETAVPDWAQLTTARLGKTLRQDADRSFMQLGFVHSGAAFNNTKLQEVGDGLPPALKELQLLLSGCMVDSVGLVALLRKLPGSLERLTLGLSRTQFSDDDLVHTMELLPMQLRHLDLNLAGTNLMETKSVSLPPGLTSFALNLSNNPVLKVAAVESWASAVPASLLFLTVHLKKTNLSELALTQLMKKLPEGLQAFTLKLDGTSVPEKELVGFSFPQNLNALEISLCNSRQFGDAGLEILAEVLPKSLRQLTLNFLSTCVGDTGLAKLAQALPPELEALSVTLAGTQVSDEGLRSLAAAMPSSVTSLVVDCNDGSVGRSRRIGSPKRRSASDKMSDLSGWTSQACASAEEGNGVEEDFRQYGCKASGRAQVHGWCQLMLRLAT